MRYAKTSLGAEVIKSRTIPLGPKQRTLLLLCDGQRSESELLSTTQGMGVSNADLQELLSLGLIEGVDVAARGVASAAAAPAPTEAVAPADPAVRYQEAYRLATQLTSELGLRGFRLQLSVESAMNLKDLQDLAPRLKEAVLAAHGPVKGGDKLREFIRILDGHT
ncbi:hypothetical protein OOT46_08630 [Aquabacterium sp. A7-Y]|uniref:hypothetical protein n=1 Tax=Aquabacterium sp. A7-Y TaxID=1349605 RepID=UPI00223E518A|nr:hypothetical protein [Aquabacterium sp. A7-Y]MCW7537913.1 hypothetical protein [Aquabacterium sp. A7-Y]